MLTFEELMELNKFLPHELFAIVWDYYIEMTTFEKLKKIFIQADYYLKL